MKMTRQHGQEEQEAARAVLPLDGHGHQDAHAAHAAHAAHDAHGAHAVRKHAAASHPHHVPSKLDRVFGEVLEQIERVLVYVVAIFLVGFAVLALVNTVVSVVNGWPGAAHNGDFNPLIVTGIDSAFLTIILLELLHTVLSRGPLSLQLQEFLVIGITSAVRRGLEIAVSSSTAGQSIEEARTHGKVPPQSNFDVVVALGINALGVLILIGALWMVRQQADKPDAPGMLESATND